MKFNQNQFLSCLSTALDFMEIDRMRDVTHHNKKVAYITDSLAMRLGLAGDDRLDLATCALLHDSGISSYHFDVSKNRCSREDNQEHCVHSERILSAFPLRKPLENILFYHHEYIDGSGFFGIKDPHLFSQLIRLADDVDNWITQQISMDQIFKNLQDSSRYDSALSTAFKEASDMPAFWLDLEPLFIRSALEKQFPADLREMSWADIRKLTRVLSGIIDKKSVFTARHSAGLSERAETIADYYEFDEDKKEKFIIAADLHDLGKLAISNDILDKPGKLSRKEFATIQRHTYYTRRALEGIDGFGEITEWAANHHERTTGRGYPFGLTDLSFESRLMAVLDIYQALTEERPYRRGLLHEEAMDIISPLGKFGGLDPDIIVTVDKIFNV